VLRGHSGTLAQANGNSPTLSVVSERDNLIAAWAETERDLRAAFAQIDIGAEASNWVAEYLDHNELGLAFATLVESLDRLGTIPLLRRCNTCERPTNG